MTPARFRWGMILVQVGLLLLLRNAGVINDNVWINLLVLSPLVLIAIGIEKIFTKSRLQFIAYATTILLFIGGFVIAFYSGTYYYDEDLLSNSIFQETVEEGTEKIVAVLNLDDTDVRIRDAGEELVFGEFDSFTRRPKIETYLDDSNTARIEFSARENSFLGGAIRINNDHNQEWYLQFCKDLPLILTCNGYDNNLHLNLATSRLVDLNLETENSSIYLKIGDNEPLVRVKISGRESSLRLRIPEEVGLKIIGSDYETYMLQIGFLENDTGAFTNEKFDSAATKIEVELDDRLNSFSLDYF